MADAKAPQDHKPKVTKRDGAFHVTIRGIDVTVPEEALDDFELADEMSRIEDGGGHRFTSVARRLFGDDYQRIMDALRGENGRVSIEVAIRFINDVMVALNPNNT